MLVVNTEPEYLLTQIVNVELILIYAEFSLN